MAKRELVTVTREDLYTQVWSEPMINLAKKYGLSDVGLRKKCKKLNIPLPPQGYFLRYERRRQRTNRPPLPPLPQSETVEIAPSVTDFPPAFFDSEQYKQAEAQITFEELQRIASRFAIASHHHTHSSRRHKQ